MKFGYRSGQIIKGALGILANRGVGMLVNVLVIPLLYSALGQEEFGVLMALLALGVAVGLGDLGVGNGIQNYLAEIQDDHLRVASVIKSGLAGLIVVATALAAVSLAASRAVDLPALFGTSTFSQAQLYRLTTLLVAMLAVQLPLNLGQRILAAYQHTHVSATWLTAGNVVGLALVVLGLYCGFGIGYFLCALLGPTVLANAASLLVALSKFGLRLSGVPFEFSGHVIDKVLATGLYFFAVQLAFTLHALSDVLLVSSELGAETLATFSLVMRVIALLVLPISAVTGPMLGAFNDAMAKGDTMWILSTTRRLGGLAVVNALIVTAAFVLLARWLLSLWIGENLMLPIAVIGSFAVVLLYQCISIPTSMALMTDPLLRRGAVVYCAAVALAFVCKSLAVTRYGLIGLNLASAGTMIVVYLVPSVFMCSRLLLGRTDRALRESPVLHANSSLL